MATTFNAAGRTYTVQFKYGTFGKIKAATGLDLLDKLSEHMPRMLQSIPLTINVAHIAANVDLSDAEFCDEMTPEEVEAAGQAVIAGIADFFQRAGQTPQAAWIRKSAKTIKEAMNQQVPVIEAQEMNLPIAEATANALQKSVDSAASLLLSPNATPTPERSAS